MRKKILSLVLATMMVTTPITGKCATRYEYLCKENQTTEYARYYPSKSEIITADGEAWGWGGYIHMYDGYSYDGMPVVAAFDKADKLEDWNVKGCMYDVYTAIYDDLEDELSDDFNVDREGNNLVIEVK